LKKQNEVKHLMWRALERAGVAADQWHNCRHTCCSHLVMKGVHIVAVMQLAGHSSFSVTLHQAHAREACATQSAGAATPRAERSAPGSRARESEHLGGRGHARKQLSQR